MSKPTMKITQHRNRYWLEIVDKTGSVTFHFRLDIATRRGVCHDMLQEVKDTTFVPEPGGEAGGVEGANACPQDVPGPDREGGSTPPSGSMAEIRSRMAQLLIQLERIKRHLTFDDYEALRDVLADYAYLVAENAKLRARLAEKPKVTQEQIAQLEEGIDNIEEIEEGIDNIGGAGQSYLGVRDDIINCILTILDLEVEE